MIKGCLNLSANDNFAQGNNVMEVLDGPEQNKCNDTAIVAAWAAVTQNYDNWVNPLGGTYRGWQPEDLVDLYFHEEKNWPAFKAVRNLPLTHKQVNDNGPYQPERIPQYHKLALRDIFGLAADYFEDGTFNKVAGLVSSGKAVILCLKQPGHYITAVCYDDAANLIGFRDPAPVKWKQNTMDANKIKWFGVADWANVKNCYTTVQ